MNNEIALFFGRFHPLLVHLPIGILLFAALLEMLAIFKKSANIQLAIQIALLTGAISAGMAALSGYALSSAGGYDQQTLFWHQWLGISIAAISIIAWWVKHKKLLNVAVYKVTISQWMVLCLMVLIGITGHLGGNLTHGSAYLTLYMPAPIKLIFSVSNELQSKPIVPSNLDSVVIYKHLVQPMLEAKCINCHNQDKAQGGLILTSEASILTGGKAGPAITPGDLKKSELIRRITLPHSSTKFMPINNLPPLSNVEVSILKWWVLKGADFTSKIGSVEVDEKEKYLLSVYLGIDTEAVTEIVLPEVSAANPAALKELRNAGILAKLISENSNQLDVSFVMEQNVSPQKRQEQLEKLLQVKEQVYWLDLSNCDLKNEDLMVLGQITNLSKLNLQKNNINDSGIIHLQGLKNLEYLNIYENPLSNNCIQVVQQLPALKKINLWKTQITKEGVAKLTNVKQDLEVIY